MKKIWIALTLMCYTLNGFSQISDDSKPETFEQKLSYSVGFDVTASLNKMGVRMDKNWMAQGIIDALIDSSKSPLFTYEEMEELFKELTNRNMVRLEEEKQALAAPNREKGAKYVELQMSMSKNLIKTESGLVYEVIKKGKSKRPGPLDKVEVKYTGTLIDGTIFDQQTTSTTVFALSEVIAGWTEGLQLMAEGATYRFIIPAELAYGNNPPMETPIQPGSTLIFIVELVKVKK